MAAEGEPFTRRTVELTSDLTAAAVAGDRAAFDSRLQEWRSTDLHDRVAVTVYSLSVLRSTRRRRRTVARRLLVAVERWVTRPLQHRRSFAYRDYLAPLTPALIAVMADQIANGTFGDLIEQPIFETLLSTDPFRALDAQLLDRHNPKFTTTVFLATAAVVSTSFRAGRVDQVSTAIRAHGLAYRARGVGTSRAALIEGFD